ncbi:hypothetical protein [Streptomyces viridochromogenes]|uniref:Uncharacterized protein n=1 Tax=Streptomyces viridochromogenes Tue57 TaxID=1160705 RepID=L8PLK4_STRVR|nr:hypothetical protein [Streptomyces viridochromogenes]ELS58411.1 hypothetical protein STVIR_0653 [Streptomyces viridochromogenes Tue57]
MAPITLDKESHRVQSIDVLADQDVRLCKIACTLAAPAFRQDR